MGIAETCQRYSVLCIKGVINLKYNGYYKCKICGKTWKHNSNWIPYELVDWFYDILFFAHLIFHHPKDATFKRIIGNLYQILLHIMIAIMWIFVTLIQIIFYPLYWFIKLLYWGTSVPLLFARAFAQLLPGRFQIFSHCIISQTIRQVNSFHKFF